MSDEATVDPTPQAEPEGILEFGNIPEVKAEPIVLKPEAPKVSIKDINKELSSLKRDEAGKPIQKEEPVEPEPVAEEAAPEPAKEAEPEAKPEPDKKKAIKNPFARARIVEKERNEAQAALRDLQIEIGRLRAAQEAKQGEVAEAKDAGPGEDAGPVDILMHEVKQIKDAIARNEAKAAEIMSNAQMERMLLAADQRIAAVHQEAPEIMEGATMHLARVVARSVERQLPDATEQERALAAHNSIVQQKLAWVQQGLDPAEQIYQLAVDMGWTPPEDAGEEMAAAVESAAKAKPVSKLDEIRIAKEKAAATKSLGAVPGRSVSSVAARTIKDTSDLNQAIKDMAAQGQIRKPTGGRVPSFSELAAALGIKPVVTR